MEFKGKGVYHTGPGGIQKPGDFGWRVDLSREQTDGIWRDKIVQIQFATYCPKFGVCCIPVSTTNPPVHPVWFWNGNWEKPTLSPSINCGRSPRCGVHYSVTDGVISYES